jgi:mRNA export factor
MAFFGQAAATATTAASNADKDIEVSDPPADSISCLSFSNATAGDYLAVGAWDNNVPISSHERSQNIC